MAITYHVVVAFARDEEGNLVPLEPAEAPNAERRGVGLRRLRPNTQAPWRSAGPATPTRAISTRPS